MLGAGNEEGQGLFAIGDDYAICSSLFGHVSHNLSFELISYILS